MQIITSGGSSASSSFSAVCTGTLINSPTGRNFVLTAYHCLEGETVSDWSFVFNYEKKCGRVGLQTSAFQVRPLPPQPTQTAGLRGRRK